MELIDNEEIRELLRCYRLEDAHNIIINNISKFIEFLNKYNVNEKEMIQINDIINSIYVSLKNKDAIMLLDILEYEYFPFQNSFTMRDKNE